MLPQTALAANPGVASPDYNLMWFARDVAQTIFVLAVVGISLFGVNRLLDKYFSTRPELSFTRYLIMIGMVLMAALAFLIYFPFSDQNRSGLLNVFGIALSALIALSATTVTGNAIAGILLKPMWHLKEGDVIRIGERMGRILSMHLLRIEVQSEAGTRFSFPNTFVISNPLEVLGQEGIAIFARVSLGYDIARTNVEQLLSEAAEKVGLENARVQIEELGDFAISYVVKGESNSDEGYLHQQSRLMCTMLDVLHGAGLEVASPHLVNRKQV